MSSWVVFLCEKIGREKACALIQILTLHNNQPFSSFHQVSIQSTQQPTQSYIVTLEMRRILRIESNWRLGKTSAQVICDSILSAAASLDKVASFIGLLLYFAKSNLFVSNVLVSYDSASAVPRDFVCDAQEPLQHHHHGGARCFDFIFPLFLSLQPGALSNLIHVK